jgi:hydroxypyruvate reductase
MALQPETLLSRLFEAAVNAALPANCLAGHFPAPPAGRIGVVAFGKAAVGMARMAWREYGPAVCGCIVAPAGEPDPELPGFAFFASSHPLPDERSVRAAESALAVAASLGRHDLLLALVSGGGSALMAAPVAGVSLQQKRELIRQLLACGAPIAEINCVRKHLSRVKGGRLAAASQAPVAMLAISDVPGDDPGSIASGPVVQDHTCLAEARAVLARYAIRVPAAIRQALEHPANESPHLGALGIRTTSIIAASGQTALQAAARLCRDEGIAAIDLGDRIEGEAGAVARKHARLALRYARSETRCCLLSGGETTVRLGPSAGRGGRNSEYALALTLALGGHPGIWALAADTDGMDGRGGHAGALIGPDTLEKAATQGLDPVSFLERNDTATFFDRIGALIRTGPTGTNVNDFRAILIGPGIQPQAIYVGL